MEVITDLKPIQLIDFVKNADKSVEFTLTATAGVFNLMLSEYVGTVLQNRPADEVSDWTLKFKGVVAQKYTLGSKIFIVYIRCEKDGEPVLVPVRFQKAEFNQIQIEDEVTILAELTKINDFEIVLSLRKILEHQRDGERIA